MIPRAEVPAATRAMIERVVLLYLVMMVAMALALGAGAYAVHSTGWRVALGVLAALTALRWVAMVRSRGQVCWLVDDEGFIVGSQPRRAWTEVALVQRKGREFVLRTPGGEVLVVNLTALEQADRIAEAIAQRLAS